MKDGFTETDEHKSGKEIARAVEMAVDGGKINLEESRGKIGTGAGSDQREMRALRIESDGCHDDMGYSICSMENCNGRDQIGEGVDLGVG